MTTYQDVVRANRPYAGWALTEASGSDFAPWLGTMRLTLTGAVSYQQTGPFAGALSMHFTSGAYVKTNIVPPWNPPGSHEFWMKVDALTSGSARVPHAYGAFDTNGYGMTVRSSPGSLIENYHAGTATNFGSLAYTIPDLNWHHYVYIVEDTTTATLYVDGQGRGRVSISPFISPTLTLAFMAASNGTYPMAGYLAYPALYPRLLTANEVYANYLASTDPTSAMAYTQQGNADLLNAILAAVRRDY